MILGIRVVVTLLFIGLYVFTERLDGFHEDPPSRNVFIGFMIAMFIIFNVTCEALA